MQIEQHSHSQSENILPEDFQQANNLIDSIQPRDSNPTKTKVKIFKNRVFHLLKIFVDKSNDVNPLIQSMKQEMFLREPEKMKELITVILNKQNIKYQNLQQLLNYYQVFLLYKTHKKSSNQLTNISVDFVAILKKLSQTNQQQAVQTIKNMLKSFAFQRKCTLKINFFFYLLRKTNISTLKSSLIQDCEGYLNDEKLRNAQKKQIMKLLERLDRNNKLVVSRKNKNSIKIQENQDQENQDKDEEIQIVKRQNIETDLNVKEENKNKKQITTEKLEKLERIKANKKKRNKQQNKPNTNTNTTTNNNNNKNHQNKKQDNNKRSQSKPHSQPKSQSFKPHTQRSQPKTRPERSQHKNTNRSNSRPKFNKKSHSKGKRN